MSIIIHFTPTSTLLSSSTVPPTPACVVDAETSLDMGPGLGNDSGLSILSPDDSSMVDISTTELYSAKENVHISSTHHSLGSYFGLPYQDHNYGAPPPPTPPSHSPPMSPVHIASTVVKTEPISPLHSIVVRNEEVPETSITRCVCGFDHDDEYMICCDRCSVWQHVDCMGLDRSKIPETYLCEKCEPRKVDRQKAKVLQAKKRVTMTEKLIYKRDTSDESEDEHRHEKSLESPSKTRSKSSKRKTEDDKDIRSEHLTRKGRSNSKHGKERMEIKRSKFRRRTKSKSESVCVGDEEAQDACSSSDWSRKREESVEGLSDTQSLGATLRSQRQIYPSIQTDDTKVPKLQLQDQLCQLVEFSGNQKKLVAATDLPKDQIIIEFKGQFLSATQFHQKNPVFSHKEFPFVLFYKLRSHEELCVDASENGNDARFVRRSCMPNAEIRHLVTNGALHLYISSIKEILKDEEITIPFDVNFKDCLHEVECACDSDTCFITKRKTDASETNERKKRTRRQTHSTDDDSNHSLVGSLPLSPLKPIKSPPVKVMSPTKLVTAPPPPPPPVLNLLGEQNEGQMSPEDHMTEEHLKEQRKKMTREERKLDAIMRAFDQMEKAAKRKQQALDRQAQQKALHPKSDDPPPPAPPPPPPPPPPEKQEIIPSCSVKEEEKQIAAENSSSVDDEKSSTATTSPVKHKKGKRRRGSGTPVRRRTRTNSGGSDIFNTDDNTSTCETTFVPSLPTTPSVETSEAVSPETVVACLTSVASPPPTTAMPKTKRFLHDEWLHEKELTTIQISSPLTIHTAMSYNMVYSSPTQYVRCTKGSSSSGISPAHLRRNSFQAKEKPKPVVQPQPTPPTQGSAKKRWLRQAMHDNDSGSGIRMEVINGEVSSPSHSVCFSPSNRSEVGSPGVTLDDVLTPLKKRRILRSSVESVSSSEWMGTSSEMSPDNSSCDSTAESCAESSAVITVKLKRESPFHKTDERGNLAGGNGLSQHLLKTRRENWIKKDTSRSTSSTSIEDKPVSIMNGCRKSLMQSSNSGQDCSENEQHLSKENSAAKMRTSEEENMSALPTKMEVVKVNDFATCENGTIPVYKQRVGRRYRLKDGIRSAPIVKDAEILSLKNISSNDAGTFCGQTDTVFENQTSPTQTVTDLVPLLNAQNDPIQNTSDSNTSDPIVTEAVQEINSQCNTVVEHPATLDMGSVDAQNSVVSLSRPSSNADSISSVSNSSSDVSISVVNVHSSLCSQEVVPKPGSTIVNEVNPEDPRSSNSAATEPLLNDATIESPKKNSPLPSPTTPRRKVSLSEYRQRKRENPSATSPVIDKKKSNNCVLATSTSLEDFPKPDIKLMALPLFDAAVNKGEQPGLEETNTSQKEQAIVDSEKKATEPRENVNERLAREFGLVVEADSDKTEMEKKEANEWKQECVAMNMTSNVAPILSLCTQLPPLPPPPSPPHPGALLNDKNSSMQYTYPAPELYAQQPFPTPQISANQYLTVQPPVTPCIIPVIRPMTPPSGIPPTCNYSATMQTMVTRPPQTTPSPYPQVNNQSYSVMAQQLLHPPYHPLFKSQVQFK